MNTHNFGLDRECQITDINCWKDQFRKKFNCSKNDQQCWVRVKQKLPCQINDITCWKKQLPQLPCDYHDKQCWKMLLPDLPCKIKDQQCWKHLTPEHIIKNKQSRIRSNPDWDQFQENQDKNIGNKTKSSGIYFREIFGMI